MALFLSRTERQALAGFAISVVIMAVLHEVVQLKELSNAIQTQLMEDYYSTLSIKDGATKQEIQTAYKRATSQLNSRPQDEEGRLRRAKVAAAYETLNNPQARQKYDHRRRLVRLAGGCLTALFAGVPALVLLGLGYRTLRPLMKGRIDPKSFEGQLSTMLEKIECTLQVSLRKGAGESLGMQLVAAKRGTGLSVQNVAEGGLVEAHNERERAAAASAAEVDGASGLIWWQSPEIRAGDVLASVNGTSTYDEMMRELRTAAVLDLSLKRPLKGMLPWAAEVELRKTVEAERWGCQLAPARDGSNSMEVAGVDDSGPLARWNAANPKLQVRPGDRVAAVDREVGVTRMLSVLQGAGSMTSTWFVVRGALPEQTAPSEIFVGPFHKREGEKLGIRIGRAFEAPVRGCLLEPGWASGMVVKDVVSDFMVDKWNRQGTGPQVAVGAAVLAVNGRTDPTAFAAELSKPSVLLQLRPSRGSPPAAAAAAAAPPAPKAAAAAPPAAPPAPAPAPPGPRRLGEAAPSPQRRRAVALEEAEAPLARRLCGRRAPSFLLPRSFEARLRDSLSLLRCEFVAEVARGSDGTRVGLQLEAVRDDIGGLNVKEVSPEGLVGRYNVSVSNSDARKPDVRPGDRLVGVNEATVPGLMIEVLSNSSVERLELRFSRKAAHSAPGVWEAEVERLPNEGWGMELREYRMAGAKGPGALRIESIAPGGAVERWNSQGASDSKWAVEPGDLLVACEPEVGSAKILNRLRTSERTRLTLLRWHAGPAPEGVAAPEAGVTIHTVDVVLERTGAHGERLGVRLDPSKRDPTRTAVTEVMAGGLVDKHNQSVLAGAGPGATLESAAFAQLPVVHPGDELESVNGERDPNRFPDCCAARRVALRLVRRVPVAQTPAAQLPAAQSPPPQPPAAQPPKAPPPAAQPPKAQPPVAQPPKAQPPTAQPSMAPVGAAEWTAPSKATPPPPPRALRSPAPEEAHPVSRPSPVSAASPVEAEECTGGWDLGGLEGLEDVGKPEEEQPPVPAPTPPRQLPPPAAAPRPAAAAAPATAAPPAAAPAAAAPPPRASPEREPEAPPEAVQAPPAAEGGKVAAALKKENFLLKAEVEALRAQCRSAAPDRSAAEELKALRAEREALKKENEALKAQTATLERSARASKSSAAEAEALRVEVKELRLQERQLQEQLRRSGDVASTNARLEREVAGLREQLTRAEEVGSQGALDPAVLGCLDEDVARLQELSFSLVQSLSCSEGAGA